MVSFAIDIHPLDRSGNLTCSFVTFYGDSLYEIFKNNQFSTDDMEYARIWYRTQSLAELEEQGEGWWNWVAQWYLTPAKLEKLMMETLC